MIGVFQTYFNIYGLFHLASSILCNVVLLYHLNDSGIDIAILTLLGGSSSQIYFTCLFGQYINAKVS